MTDTVAASPAGKSNVDYRFKLGKYQSFLDDTAAALVRLENEVGALPIRFADITVQMGKDEFRLRDIASKITDLRNAIRGYQDVCKEGWAALDKGADLTPRVRHTLDTRFDLARRNRKAVMDLVYEIIRMKAVL